MSPICAREGGEHLRHPGPTGLQPPRSRPNRTEGAGRNSQSPAMAGAACLPGVANRPVPCSPSCRGPFATTGAISLRCPRRITLTSAIVIALASISGLPDRGIDPSTHIPAQGAHSELSLTPTASEYWRALKWLATRWPPSALAAGCDYSTAPTHATAGDRLPAIRHAGVPDERGSPSTP